jgi:predicted PurR-regulated permease PerM
MTPPVVPPSRAPSRAAVVPPSSAPAAAPWGSDLARTTLQLLMLGALITTSLWIMRPFLIGCAWATMIAVATWPLLMGMERRFGGRRAPAAAALSIALLLLLFVPLYFAVAAIVANAAEFVHWSRSVASITIPEPPAWVAALPVVGGKLTARWQQLAAAGPEEVAHRLAPFARSAALWFVGNVGSVGRLLVQLLLTVIVAAILYSRGDTAARGVDRFAYRLAGVQGTHAVHLAAQAIRAVALGVIVTAIAQSALAGLGIAIAGVPYAAILTALMFILSVAQIGPAPVLIPAVVWVYFHAGAGTGSVFLVWAIICGAFDNVVRPLLIKRGADLPLLLIFVGVIGGLIAFGVIGLFIGPVVLAVGYELLAHWVSQGDSPEEPHPLVT